MTAADPACWDDSLPGLRARLVRRARRLGVDAQTAEDLTQETLAEGWRLRDRLYDPAGVEQWLQAILGNVHRRWLRRRGRERVHLVTDAGVEELSMGSDAGMDDPFDVEVELERRELVDLLDRAMALLAPEMREILVQRFVAEMPVGELAARLGVSHGAVQMRLQRGKLALRRILTTDYGEDALAFGLIDDAEVGWQETRIWCPGCGAGRWQGRFRGPRRELEFRCQLCAGWYVRESDTTSFGVTGFGATMRKVSILSFDQWQDGLRSLGADPHGHRSRIWRYQHPDGQHQLVGECSLCDWDPATTIESLALFTPEGREFWRDHPRIRRIVNRDVVAGGVPAVVTSYESVTDRSRLDVVLTRDDFRVVQVDRS